MSSWVLVTNAQSRAALSVIRSLGQKGIRVAAADSDRLALGLFSRYCARRLRYPDPAGSEPDYYTAVSEELQRHPYDVVMPLFDDCLLPLAQRRNEVMSLTRFPYKDYDGLMQGRDKARTIQIARRCGLRTPETFEIHGEVDVTTALAHCSPPLIVRPRQSAGSDGVHRVDRPELVWPTCSASQNARPRHHPGVHSLGRLHL